MSLFGSLSAGASAVRSFGRAMTVVGSNIANVNTYGFKGNRVMFEDILASDFNQGAVDTELSKGVSIANIDADFTQGAFEQTHIDTDMAINGEGFFTVRNDVGKEFYTRVGQFTFDKDGFLTTDRGLKVMTRQLNPISGEPVGEPNSLKVLGLVDPPKRTGDGITGPGVVISANLNSKSPVRETPFDPTNVRDSMVNFTTSVSIHDDLGAEHTAVVAFRKRPDIPPQTGPNGEQIPGVRNQWEWYVLFDGADVGGEPGVLQAEGGGFLQFDDEGRLLQAIGGEFVQQGGGIDPATGQPLPVTGPPILQPVPIDPEAGIPQIRVGFNGGPPRPIGINLGMGSNPADPNDDRSGLDGVTQFASSSRLIKIDADGNPSGALDSISVQIDGTVLGFFDGGFTRDLGQLVLTRFDNPQKLVKNGENVFAASLESGHRFIGKGGVDGFGQVHSQTLEQSNVDLAAEFVRMMELQRGFQANTKSITAADEMVQDLVALKR